MMRNVAAVRFAQGKLILAVCGTVLVARSAARGPDETRPDDEDRGGYAIGLWGDLPYSALQATVGVPNLIQDMNRQDLAFSAHDGDLKAGSGSPCNDALYSRHATF